MGGAASHLVGGPDRLKDDLVIEAYMRARCRLRMRGRLTKGGEELQGPMAMARWRMTGAQREKAGPKIWETTTKGAWRSEQTGCEYSRALAAAVAVVDWWAGWGGAGACLAAVRVASGPPKIGRGTRFWAVMRPDCAKYVVRDCTGTVLSTTPRATGIAGSQ